MRILYLCTYYHRAMIFRNAIDNLEKRGNKLLAFNAVQKGTVIDPKYEGIMDEKVVHSECFKKNDRYVYFYKQNKIFNAVKKQIDLKDWELIHSHTLFNGGWVAYKLKRDYGIPYVVSVRNVDENVFLRIPFFKKIARKIMRNASGVLFLSESYKERFVPKCFSKEEQKIIQSKCVVIPNALEAFWLENKGKPRKRPDKKVHLLCVGKIDHNKNMRTVIKAAEHLMKKGWDISFTVVGQVNDERELNILKEKSFVDILSYKSKEELLDIYRQHDIFVLPSYFETFGRVYAEAMSQGVPVIYTRGQGFDGFFGEGEVGYSVQANGVDEIAEAIERICHNYENISTSCIEKCTYFDAESIAERLEIFYKDAILLF